MGGVDEWGSTENSAGAFLQQATETRSGGSQATWECFESGEMKPCSNEDVQEKG